MIHLDTSFLICALVRGSPQDHALRTWIKAGESLAASSLVWAEFLCGPVRDHDLELASQVITGHAEFNHDHATIAARLFNDTGRRRGTLIDCMVAATALAADAPLATENPADFRRFEASGLRILQGGRTR